MGRSVTPSRQSRRIDTPVAIRSGEGAQMRWCGEHGCYPRVRPVSWGTLGVPSWVPGTVLHFSRNVGLPLRRRHGQGPHLAKRWEPRGFSRVAAAFSSYDGDLSLPLGLALGSPIFPSSCEGKLGVALESLQGPRDLTTACVRDLIFLSREGRDLGVAFHAPPGSQASSRGEAKDSALLSSRDAGLW